MNQNWNAPTSHGLIKLKCAHCGAQIIRRPNKCVSTKDFCNQKCFQASQANLITVFGRTQSITAWAEEIGIDKNTIRWRIKRLWPIEKVLAPAWTHRANKQGAA